ncbi:Uncharacterized protein APZ42_032084 [Daphnia magna]|uniref:Uncharacterized protein n=1 Tax=Daphnia magna TaxID=35525 RepID=A0A164MB61_9CRUS|nr:Uncharacterized protein APZ42_032084 [Daphnia magna]
MVPLSEIEFCGRNATILHGNASSLKTGEKKI